MKAYSLESVIAEKFHAAVYLADMNSRMKYFYDIYELSRSNDFDGAILSEAILQVFKNRNTSLFPNPVIFTKDFPLLHDKQIQWQAFLHRTNIIDTPADFPVIIAGIRKFILPIYEALLKDELLCNFWKSEKEMWCKNLPI